jgi:Tfp pilus assembly protein PilN
VNAVNLLPTKHRPRTPTGRQQGSAYVVVGVLGALLLLVVFYVLTVNGVNTRKDQVARAKAETAQARARAGALSSYGDFSKVKETRVQSVKMLADGRIDWERLTRGLARVLPDRVWLTSASASATGTPSATGSGGTGAAAPTPAGVTDTNPKVQLVGCAPSHATVAVALVRLRELAGAKDVQLTEITRPEPTQNAGGGGAPAAAGGDSDCGQFGGVPAVKWGATVTFDGKTGSAVTGVPKSLGGGA